VFKVSSSLGRVLPVNTIGQVHNYENLPEAVECAKCGKSFKVAFVRCKISTEVPARRIHLGGGVSTAFAIRCPACSDYTVFGYERFA
jgi:hypothetical protein